MIFTRRSWRARLALRNRRARDRFWETRPWASVPKSILTLECLPKLPGTYSRLDMKLGWVPGRAYADLLHGLSGPSCQSWVKQAFQPRQG